jgi:flagellar M-ring protein FliF
LETILANAFWHNLSRASRAGLIGGVALIAAASIGAGVWLLKTDYQVLFADMTPQDTAAVTAELDRLKTPYKLDDDGRAILVDRNVVHAVRLKVMAKELPLHGAVGFELFNNTDFGMTEFAQKINLQRALQGELTRTILALSEIADVRVHLAVAEQGLFRQQANRAKAAIEVTLKPGRVLGREQVSGIQRLVSAAVPGMAIEDVTIVDQHGVALTRAAANDGELSERQLDLKRETENYLTRKITQVLDATFGPGRAIASVDASLDMDQVRSTQENVLAAPGADDHARTGVLVRERETVHEAANSAGGNVVGAARPGAAQHERDYQVGRRVQQVVSQPGSVRRLQVAVLIYKRLDAAEVEQIRRVVAAAAGVSVERGDSVAVESVAAAPTAALPATPAQPEAAARPSAPAPAADNVHPVVVSLLLLLLTVLGAGGARLLLSRKKGAVPALTDAQRQQALERVRFWLRESDRGELA